MRKEKNNLLTSALCLCVTLLLAGSAVRADEDRVAPLEPGSFPPKFAVDFLWTADQMPIKFRLGFVSTDEMKMDLPEALRYEKILMDSFAEWNKASEGRISMMYENDQGDWDAGIEIADQTDETKSDSRCCKSSLNARKPDTAGQRAFLRIIIPRRANGTPPSDSEVRSICLHELGHVLGLVHSSDSKDVMYAGPSGGADHIGPGDVVQFLNLYGALPKVDATELAQRVKKEHQKSLTWIEGELARHKQALKDNPNDANTIGGIARCHSNLGKPDDAAEEYNKEITLDPDPQNQFGARWSIRALPRLMQFYQLAQIVAVQPSDGRLAKYVKMAIDNADSPPPPQAMSDNAATQSGSDQAATAQPAAPAQDNNQPQESRIPLGEAQFTLEQLKQYYNVYNLPDVKYLRILFDGYLKGTGGTKEEIGLLKKWDKSYYHSKFMVTSRNIHPFGGTSIQLMFQDRPDQVFDAWVYPNGSSNRPELRALDKAGFSDEDIRRIKIRYKKCLEDKVHAG